jgi:hypothetical protein
MAGTDSVDWCSYPSCLAELFNESYWLTVSHAAAAAPSTGDATATQKAKYNIVQYLIVCAGRFIPALVKPELCSLFWLYWRNNIALASNFIPRRLLSAETGCTN